MNWLEVKLDTEHERVERLCMRLEALGVEGFCIEDEADVTDFLENERKYWDYVDDSVIEAVKGVCSVKFYLEDSAVGEAELSTIKEALSEYELSVKKVRDEDWVNNWKLYYKPIETGERLVIVPEWEETPEDGRTPLRLDPGLIFGTGSHATTRMCLEAAEKCTAAEVLDVGCGSGILAIAALLLGAEHAVCCDIDDKAPDVVRANAALNGIGEDRLTVYAGNALEDADLRKTLFSRKYGLIFANIVADVIISLLPDIPGVLANGGTFIASGIIDGREKEILDAVGRTGLRAEEHVHIDNWHAFVIRGGAE